MVDALWMSNFCCGVDLRWNEHCGQFSASCNIEIQKKLFFPIKKALNHVWCTLDFQFLLCCLFEMKLPLWTVFSKLQHWSTENLFFNKHALWMSNFCCAVYLRWNYHCGQFSASCNIEIQKPFFSNKQALNHVWCTPDVQFLLCCLFKMEWTLWTVFRKLQHWNTQKSFFP